MLQEKVELKRYSNYKIGGLARYFYIVKNLDQLEQAVAKAQKDKLKIFILGGGTNLLISDDGFNGLVIKPEIMKLENSEVMVKVGAGVFISELLDFLISKSLSGMEWAGGLPGTVGGAIRGNAGAFAGEMKDVVEEVVSLVISGSKPKIVRRRNNECRFGYRDSIFKQQDNREIILEATLRFKKGNRKIIRNSIEDKIRYREERQPLDYPNIGSIFKNVPLSRIAADLKADIAQLDANTVKVSVGRPQRLTFIAPIKVDPFPVIPTAHLIHEAGLKGISYGGAMISPKHPNFIVNVLNAKAEDVKKLIKLVKFSVKSKFGIELEEEIIYV